MTGLEVRRAGRVVLVQDPKAPASGGGAMQAWSVDEWAALVRVIKQDAVHTDVLSKDPVLPLVIFGLHRHDPLYVDLDDWAPFVAAAKAGEYDIDKLSSGDADSPVSADGAVRVVAGAGKAGNPPSAPAATASGFEALLADEHEQFDARSELLASIVEYADAPPLAASSGPNVAAMDVPGLNEAAEFVRAEVERIERLRDDLSDREAAIYVPAGRPTPAPAQVALPQEAGRPGPDAMTTDVDLVRPDFLTGVDVEEWAREWAEAAWGIGFAAGRSAIQEEFDEAREWAKRTAPLVPPADESSRIGVAAGGAPAEAGVSEGGEAGPGSLPVGPGPAEPSAVDCADAP